MPGGPNLRVYFYNITSACMCLKPNRPTIKTETQERAYKSRDVFFKILFVGWASRKSVIFL